MSRAIRDAPATYFRLAPESLAEIREAYRAGATAHALAIKWKVSPSTIYRHATLGGWQKKRDGDAISRAHARAFDQRENDAGDALCAYFDGIDGALGADAAKLGERALRASAQAMRQGAFAQGRLLAQMAETFYRIAPNQRDDMLTVAFRVATDDMYAQAFFTRDPDDDCPKKLGFWMHRAAQHKHRGAAIMERRRLEAKVSELEVALARFSPAS